MTLGGERSICQEEAVTLDTGGEEDGIVVDEEVGVAVDEAIVIIHRRQLLRASTLSILHKEKRNITLKSDRQRRQLHLRLKSCLTEV